MQGAYRKNNPSPSLKIYLLKGLTLDIDRGNLLRLGKDGVILAASHGTRKMFDAEIERVYGRGRKKHVAFDYATHLHVSSDNFGHQYFRIIDEFFCE